MAAALLMALSAGNALALGLGDIELKSALNQPLDAEIELLSATDAELEELKVAIGSPDSFARAGIDRPVFLSKLRFDVARNDQGEPVIQVSSRDLVQEPFLDFILEVSWSKGRLVREYTVLVDPPLTMPAPPPESSAPAVAARPAPAQQSARRFTHTGNFPTVPLSPGEYGPTRRNDTLWKVAQQVRPDAGVSMEQTMLGLLRANPRAFVGNNINNLKAGYVLRVPDRDELTSVSKADALRETRAQYAAWRAAQGVPATTRQQSAEPAPGEVTTPAADAALQDAAKPSLQLVSPDMETGESPTGADTKGSKVDALERDLMMANEVLEAQRRQDEEMSRRLEMLEEQIVNMQRLIQLKDNELARLQAVAGEQAVDAPPVEVPDAVAESAPVEEAVDAVADDQVILEESEAGMLAGVSELPLDDVAAEAEPEVVESVASGVVADSVVADDMTAAVEPAVADSAEAVIDELIAEQAFDVAESDVLAERTAAVDETEAVVVEQTGVAATADPVIPVESPVETSEVVPEAAETVSAPGFVDSLLQNPLYLGAGALVLALLGFFGFRRKRGVESEFQESILQAAHEDSAINIGDSVDISAPGTTDQSGTDSSLLSEFAVSDMGSLRSGGEADPLSEADVYLAYGRYQQAEDLIRESLQGDADNDALNLKLLEVYLAARNQSAFDEFAQDILARLESSEDPLWEKVAEMGRELNPENPMYQVGSAASSVDGEVDEIEELEEGLDFDFSNLGAAQDESPAEKAAEPEEPVEADAIVDYETDIPVDADDEKLQPLSNDEIEGFDNIDLTPAVADEQAEQPRDAGLSIAMDSVEPDNVTQESGLDFDIDSMDLGAEQDDVSGDGELADLDEISTKLDLARAYIDMGDPDGARSILDEVLQEGNSEQKDEAQDIMQMIA
mgnify:CR=1 FL=1